MAKRAPKIKLVRAGVCERVEITPRPGSRYGNPIGFVCKADGGYDFGTLGQSAPKTPKARKKTKKSAVLAVIKSYQRWIGLAPGRLRYD